jgi:hypothetical protein
MQVFVCFDQRDKQFAEALIQQLRQYRVVVNTPPELFSTDTRYLQTFDACVLIVSEYSLDSLDLRHISSKYIGLQQFDAKKILLPIFLDDHSHQQAWSTIRTFQSLVRGSLPDDTIIKQALYVLGIIDVISIQESGPLLPSDFANALTVPFEESRIGEGRNIEEIRSNTAKRQSYSVTLMTLAMWWSHVAAFWRKIVSQKDINYYQAAKKSLPFAVVAGIIALLLIVNFSLRGLTQGKILSTTPTSGVSQVGSQTPEATATLTPFPSPTMEKTATPIPSATRPPSGSTLPIGKTIWLRAVTGNYVSIRTDQTNSQLYANAAQVQGWEKFDVSDAGHGMIALKARANGKYVSACADQRNTPLAAISSTVDDWEIFTWVNLGNGEIALQANANGEYVSARTNRTNTPLNAQSDSVQSLELFTWGMV